MVEDELPEPQPGEVRVKILAAGVAWGDILKREGFGIGARPPFTPGYDMVGVVDKLGEGVSTVKVGQMVAGLPVFGGYAEFLCLPVSELVRVPSGLDPAEAVCLVMNYVAAYQMLHRAARVRPGERVLIHSAAGGVGMIWSSYMVYWHKERSSPLLQSGSRWLKLSTPTNCLEKVR